MVSCLALIDKIATDVNKLLKKENYMLAYNEYSKGYNIVFLDELQKGNIQIEKKYYLPNEYIELFGTQNAFVIFQIVLLCQLLKCTPKDFKLNKQGDIMYFMLHINKEVSK